MQRALIAAVLLAGVGTVAEDLADPALSPRESYETGLRVDQQGFDEALRGLNGRFKTALEKLHVDARDKGDLDETLAAKQLWERVVPLATAVVFGADAPSSGPVQIALPPPPAGRGLIAEAYSNYAGKVSTLAGHFNTAASNRQARYMTTLDALVKDLTKQGDFAGAVQVRDRRAAAERAGPVRLVTGDKNANPGLSGQQVPPAFAGIWRFTGPIVQPAREFKADGRLYERFDNDGASNSSPYRVMDPTVIVCDAYGWEKTFRAMPDGTLILDARRQSDGTVMRFVGRRYEQRVPPAFLGRWRFTGPVWQPIREFREDGQLYDYYDDPAKNNSHPFVVIDPSTIRIEFSGWVNFFRAMPDGTLQVRADNRELGQSFQFVGRRDAAPAGGHPVLGTWLDTYKTWEPGSTRAFGGDGTMILYRPNGAENMRALFTLTGPDTATTTWPKGDTDRYRVLPDGRLEISRKSPDGKLGVFISVRPGSVTNTLWKPGGNTWAAAWQFEGKGVEGGRADLMRASGRDNIWHTHPINIRTPSKWQRTVRFTAGRPHALRLDVCAQGPRESKVLDWVLRVLVNSEEVLTKTIASTSWESIEIRLDRFAGQEVKIELLNSAGGSLRWDGEDAYWDNVRLE